MPPGDPFAVTVEMRVIAGFMFTSFLRRYTATSQVGRKGVRGAREPNDHLVIPLSGRPE